MSRTGDLASWKKWSEHAFGTCGGAILCAFCRRYEAEQRWRADHPITSGEIAKRMARWKRMRDEMERVLSRLNDRTRRLNEMRAARLRATVPR